MNLSEASIIYQSPTHQLWEKADSFLREHPGSAGGMAAFDQFELLAWQLFKPLPDTQFLHTDEIELLLDLPEGWVSQTVSSLIESKRVFFPTTIYNDYLL